MVTGPYFTYSWWRKWLTRIMYKLIDAGVARAPMIPQHLTPGLQELERDGVVAFAARHMFDPRLTKDELARLDEAEVRLAASAAELWAHVQRDRALLADARARPCRRLSST